MKNIELKCRICGKSKNRMWLTPLDGGQPYCMKCATYRPEVKEPGFKNSRARREELRKN